MSNRTYLTLRSVSAAGAVLAFLAGAAQAAPAPRSTGIAAFVNGAVISNYDLDQRTALFVATSGIRPADGNLSQIRAQILRSLEDEVIQLQEAGKHNITASKPEVDRALQNIAGDNKMTVPQLMGSINQAGVTTQTFVQQLSAQIIWQKLVTARYGTDVLINDTDVNEAMAQLQQSIGKPQYLLSEIYIGVDRAEDDASVRASAEQFIQQITQGASFQTVANQFSQSPSAKDGGDIGWVIQGQMTEELDRAIAGLSAGQIAGPIRAEGGYYILLLRERREPAGTTTANATAAAPADANAAIPLDRFTIPLPPNANATLKERAMTLASQVKGQVKTCADLPNIARQLQGTVHQRLGNMAPKDLNPELRAALAKSAPGDVMSPFVSPAGVEMIVRCDAPAPTVATVELPTREQLRQQLFTQRMSLYAKSYLQDLRRNAVVSTLGN